MTDEAYDAQTLATSARIERLHALRFGPPRRTWSCPECLTVHRETRVTRCPVCISHQMDAGTWHPTIFAHYGASDTEALIFSRAN